MRLKMIQYYKQGTGELTRTEIHIGYPTPAGHTGNWWIGPNGLIHNDQGWVYKNGAQQEPIYYQQLASLLVAETNRLYRESLDRDPNKIVRERDTYDPGGS